MEKKTRTGRNPSDKYKNSKHVDYSDLDLNIMAQTKSKLSNDEFFQADFFGDNNSSNEEKKQTDTKEFFKQEFSLKRLDKSFTITFADVIDDKINQTASHAINTTIGKLSVPQEN